MTILGAHVDSIDPVGAATALGVEAVQFFLGDPQSWKKPTVLHPGGAEVLRQEAADAGVRLFIHSPYVINVASTNNRIRIPSRKLLAQTLALAAEIDAAGVIVHGGHVTADDPVEKGFENWFKAVDGIDVVAPMLIENTAGGDMAMCRRLDRIETVWQAVSAASGAENVGFCLDTCHAHAGGLELLGLVDELKAITGRIDLVHANDSRDGFDSGRDRHANLGEGQCDPVGLVDIFRSAGAPLLLETPSTGHAKDLRWLQEAVKE